MNYNKVMEYIIRTETAIVIWLFMIAYITAQANALILYIGVSATVIFYALAQNYLKN